MKGRPISYLLGALVALVPAATFAQESTTSGTAGGNGGAASAPAAEAPAPQPKPQVIQHMRVPDRRGLNVFEPPKSDGVPFPGFRLDWGGSFTQQFQSLSHENAADVRVVSGVDTNQLMDIGAGFNNATANLDLNAQLAPGIRVALTTYLSSRHHQEAWVKDGYLLIDESPLNVALLDKVMEVVTLKVGHFEIDYGDAHYRRSDNGSAIFNPFVGNLILDAFTTQIGAHVYARKSGFLAMAGVTGGEIKGEIRFPDRRSPAYLAKVGFDRQLSQNVRVRLTGSGFRQAKAISNTLYGGDRAGSRYYLVMENTAATTNAQAWSGNINPGFGSEVTSVMVNPFIEVGGLELFGVLERTEGRAAAETEDRVWKQYAADAVYRFLGDDLYLGARYNLAQGALAGLPGLDLERVQLSGGWFINHNVLLKGEWVRQSYEGFPTTDIRSSGRFKGFVLEGVVSF